uniref:Mitochondrial carrier protein n=1 Tax=Octactis speculum TaxID=3111310 RepID=A0A7S2AZA3_9STRA
MDSNPNLRYARESVSGAVAGFVCATLLSPLDVMKTRMQAQGAYQTSTGASVAPKYHGIVRSLRTILAEEGIKGWFRGYTTAVMTVPLFWACYFPTYEFMKTELSSRTSLPVTSTPVRVSAAMCAGVITDTLTNPLWVIRTRLVTQHMSVGIPAARRTPTRGRRGSPSSHLLFDVTYACT